MIKSKYRNLPENEFVPLCCVSDPFLGRYEINKKGEVRLIATKQNLKPNFHLDYPKYRLSSDNNKIIKYHSIHLLLARTFLESDNPSKIYVDHKDRNKLNYSLSNLNYISASENNKNKDSFKQKNIFFIKLDDNGSELERIDGQEIDSNLRKYIMKSIQKNKKYKGYFWKRINLDVEKYLFNFSKEELKAEVWKEIPGFETSGWKVSNLGRVMNMSREITLGSLNKTGYRVIKIGKNHIRVHRAVVSAFILNEAIPDNIIIDHLDTNREHNWVSNLKICNNRKENSNNPETLKKFSKPVLQYDLNGNFIKEHESIKKAGLSLGLKLRSGERTFSKISLCCRGSINSSAGYIWRYKESNDYQKHIDVSQMSFQKVLPIPVAKYELDGITKLSSYKSLTSLDPGFNKNKVSEACKTGKPYKGYIWKYE